PPAFRSCTNFSIKSPGITGGLLTRLRWVCILLGHRTRIGSRFGALVDLPLEAWASVVRDNVLSLCRRCVDHLGQRCAARFLYSICTGRRGHTRPGVPHAPSGRYGPVSLRPKSDVSSG